MRNSIRKEERKSSYKSLLSLHFMLVWFTYGYIFCTYCIYICPNSRMFYILCGNEICVCNKYINLLNNEFLNFHGYHHGYNTLGYYIKVLLFFYFYIYG